MSKIQVSLKMNSHINNTQNIDNYCGRSLYGATKAAISSLTRTMADDLGTYGIRVNVDGGVK